MADGYRQGEQFLREKLQDCKTWGLEIDPALISDQLKGHGRR